MDSLINIQSVLLVDNNENSRSNTTKVLENNGVKKNSTFKNAPSALTYLLTTKQTYQLILVEVNLPLMNGFEFINEFKKIQNGKKHGEICLLSNVVDSVESSEAKFHSLSIIEKPFSFEKIKHLK